MFKFIMPKFIWKIEKWKWNDEYRIYVSNTGKFIDEHKKPIPVKINENGYVLIKTPYGKKLGHRLVMMTWCPTANMEALTVDHLDHNKRNNAIDNLEWVTKEENCRRAKEDFIDGRKKNKVVVPVNQKLKRYNRTDFTMEDLELYVNGQLCQSVEEAYQIGEKEIYEKHPKKSCKICRDHYVIEALAIRYNALLNRCNHKEKNVIDGITTVECFKFLNLSVKVKKQEDEE